MVVLQIRTVGRSQFAASMRLSLRKRCSQNQTPDKLLMKLFKTDRLFVTDPARVRRGDKS